MLHEVARRGLEQKIPHGQHRPIAEINAATHRSIQRRVLGEVGVDRTIRHVLNQHAIIGTETLRDMHQDASAGADVIHARRAGRRRRRKRHIEGTGGLTPATR